MRKVRITAMLLALCMVFSLLPFAAMAAEEDKIIVHVDANAKFAGDGSEAKPFKTIEAAQTFLRSRDHRKKHAEVIVHAGIYPQELTLTFTQEDSGNEKYPVIYRAAGDGEVRMTNAVTLNLAEFKPVTDKAVLTRIPAEAQSKVGELDLSEYKIDFSALNYGSRIADTRYNATPVTIYLNDKKQDLARWPNIGFQPITTVVEAGDATPTTASVKKKGEWKYNNLRPERWEKADQAIVHGYIGSEYNMDHVPLDSVNTEKKTIVLARGTSYGVKPGHRWYVDNLLEEIDSPGEFFIDANTKKLYWYPPYKLKTTDKLTLSTHSKTYVKFEGASYITFDGINVYDSLSNYAFHIKNSDHITIRNATIQNIGQHSVFIEDSKNTLVEACTIQEIGDYGIRMKGGGDIQTITPGNNRVANCHFYRWATRNNFWGNHAVNIGRSSYNTTIGDIVENNLIHGQPSGQGLHFGGLENQIRYNEIASIAHDAADCGVIYAGRTLNEWGNEISYNYIHDYGAIFEARYQVQAIYWDDWMSGQNAHHNIIVPGTKNRTAGNLFVGADSYYCENIVVNSDIGVRATDREKEIHSTAYNTTKDTHKANSPAILEKYPRIREYKEELDKNGMMLLCANNVFENNLSVDVNSNRFHDTHIKNGKFNNNQISDDYGVFVDAANHDYRLTSEAVKQFGFPDTVLNENNFSMDKIGVQPEIMKLEKPETPFRLLYPTNGQTNVIRNTAYIKWEAARYADMYEYVVATDPDLKNVVASGTTLYNLVELPDLQGNTVYYYKVWAKNVTRQMGNTWASEGVPYMFKTTATDVLETEMLKEEIKNIKALREKVAPLVGDALGQYKPEVLTAIDDKLSNAQRIANKTTGSQEEIQNSVADLQLFQEGITGYKRAGHENIKITDGTWLVNDTSISASKTGNTLKLESFSDGWAYLNEPTPGYTVKHFRMKINYNGWTGISIKQSNPESKIYDTGLKSYFLVIKPEQIEFQKKNPAAATTGVITTYPNQYIREDEWVDVEFGSVDVPGGVNIFLKVNGNIVLNEYDTETPCFGDGYFVIRPGGEGAVVELQEASSVPTEEFVYSGASSMDQAKTIYNLESRNAVKTGVWTNSDDKTADGSTIWTSVDPTASVTYTVTDTEVPYKTYYYHEPIAGGDPNATISMVAYSPTDGGKTNVVRKIDFSQGEKGWVYLGTYECASHSKTGDIVFTIEGSGQGTLVAPVVATVRADKELLEFNRTFYDYSENLLLMKIDSQKAYKVQDELAIPDTAPYIENGRTMVPLRFVSEAFGAQVDWNAETQTATITNGSNVVAFTLGNKNYTANGEVRESETEAKLVNGRTMIPLRATAEALGKKVMWYGDARLIFIADNFGFAESDTAKLQNAAKGFDKGFN